MKKLDQYNFFLLYIKDEWNILLSKNREAMLIRVNEYYENSKEVLREKAKNKYTKLSEEEKNIKREYGRNRYHNMCEEDKQELK